MDNKLINRFDINTAGDLIFNITYGLEGLGIIVANKAQLNMIRNALRNKEVLKKLKESRLVGEGIRTQQVISVEDWDGSGDKTLLYSSGMDIDNFLKRKKKRIVLLVEDIHWDYFMNNLDIQLKTDILSVSSFDMNQNLRIEYPYIQ